MIAGRNSIWLIERSDGVLLDADLKSNPLPTQAAAEEYARSIQSFCWPSPFTYRAVEFVRGKN
jgi:hypothetical protein